MNTRKFIFLLCLSFLLSGSIFSQENFRIRSDFSTKEKFPDGKMRLTMGTVYYDKNTGKLVYDVSFPQKETWVFVDTTCYMFKQDSLVKKTINPFFQKTSIFHFALTNNLVNFGLSDIVYDITNVKKQDELIIITWTPKEKFKDNFGKIITSKKDNKLYGVVIYNKEEKIVSKQLFEEYIRVENIDFPTKITQILYTPKGESYQLTNYKNLKINETQNNLFYNYFVK